VLGLYREWQTKLLDRFQIKAAKFVHNTGGLVWESLVQRRKIARMCALFKTHKGKKALKIGDCLQAPNYLRMVEYDWKMSATKQRRDVDKFSFLNRNISDINRLSEGKVRNITDNTHLRKG
jgi:hypothetical protein